MLNTLKSSLLVIKLYVLNIKFSKNYSNYDGNLNLNCFKLNLKHHIISYTLLIILSFNVGKYDL